MTMTMTGIGIGSIIVIIVITRMKRPSAKPSFQIDPKRLGPAESAILRTSAYGGYQLGSESTEGGRDVAGP